MEQNKIKWYQQNLFLAVNIKLKMEKNPYSITFRSQTKPIHLAMHSLVLGFKFLKCVKWHNHTLNIAGKQREINLIRRRITVILSQICLNYGLKGNQRQGCGNSFREAVPLRDSVQKGMLLVLDAVEGYVKGTGGGLVTTFFLWFPLVASNQYSAGHCWICTALWV